MQSCDSYIHIMHACWAFRKLPLNGQSGLNSHLTQTNTYVGSRLLPNQYTLHGYKESLKAMHFVRLSIMTSVLSPHMSEQ